MLYIMVCDDDAFYREQMETCLLHYQEERNEKFAIDVYQDGAEVCESKREYDLYFLDIEMKNKSGVEAAQNILKRYPMATIVFFTAHRSYMDDALRLRISGYVDKPFDEKRINRIMDKLMPVVRKKRDKVKLRNEVEDFVEVKLDNIVCIKTENKKVVAITIKGNMRYMGKYNDLVEIAENHEFVKVREKCMVNMQYIKNIKNGNVLMKYNKEEREELVSRSISIGELKLKWLDYKRRTMINE